MPSHSVAQRNKMAVLYKQGKITKAQWEEFKHIVPAKKTKKKAKKKGGD